MNDLGVVEPMRLPIPPAMTRWWGALPLLGRVFVGLAVIDVIGRIAGFLSPQFMFFDFVDPVVLVAQLFPRELVILLPALVLSRRADAAAATPLVLRGAVLLALVELIAPLVMNGFASLGPENIVIWTLLSLIAPLARALAWVTIGLGLLALSRNAPSPNVAGSANLVAGALGGLALLQLFLVMTGPRTELGDPASDGLFNLARSFFVLEPFALAFLGRIVVRGYGDSLRPAQATRLAATAFGVLGVVALVDVTLGLATLFRTAFGLGFIPVIGSVDSQTAFGYAAFLGGWFFSGLMTSAFLASFALGLADTSARSTSDEKPEPSDGPSWPEPGRDPSSWPNPEISPSR
jgi:hypothetical protein